MNDAILQMFYLNFHKEDVDCVWRKLLNDDETDLLIEHKLLRYVGKREIGKRAGRIQSGTKINQDHVDQKSFIIVTEKGKQLILFNEL